MSGQRKPPWYRQTHWLDQAGTYMEAWRSLPDDAPQHAQIRAFAQFSIPRLIFESNIMEGAGLSEGETRRIVNDLMPELHAHARDFLANPSSLFRQGFDANAAMAAIQERPYLFPFLKPLRVRFAGKERGFQEVQNHVGALLSVVAQLGSQPSDEPPALLSEELLRSLHARMAEELHDPEHLVPPGHYRIDNRMAGNTVFLAHELIPDAMQRFIAEANQLMTEQAPPWHKAAWISHRFVEIHPFPDFNGRISRLLLVMVLYAFGVPFAVASSGRKRAKARYLYALRKADAGDLRPLEILIARAIVEDFQEIDRQLRAAGIEPLLPP